ncbi:MAG: trypsin-like serine protease [Pseudomonadota bacterium]
MQILALVVSIFLSVPTLAIVGGQLSSDSDRHSQSTVGLSTGCTGTLISSTHVLTAAHCIQPGRPIDIVFGLAFRGSERIAVSDIVVHPGFSGFPSGSTPQNPANQPVHDIAVLKMVADAPDGFLPAVVGYEPLLENGDTLLLAGFGQTNPFTGAGFGRMRFVTTLFNFYNENALEIVFGPTPGQSACRGDSGGPMYIFRDNQLHVIGVTSRGFSALGPCSGNGNYTDVQAHLNWIEEVQSEL